MEEEEVAMRMHAVITRIALCLTSVATFAATPPKLNAFSEGERLLYTRIVEAYRKNDAAELTRQRDLLAKNYPKSVHLDNAFYLSGVLEFQNNHMSEAVRNFGIVADRYPHSNKRPAALFAKAMTYQKLGLKPQASHVLNEIVKEYPGSQESQRAWMQLKIAGETKGSASVKR
jgi:TolA-binding protein